MHQRISINIDIHRHIYFSDLLSNCINLLQIWNSLILVCYHLFNPPSIHLSHTNSLQHPISSTRKHQDLSPWMSRLLRNTSLCGIKAAHVVKHSQQKEYLSAGVGLSLSVCVCFTFRTVDFSALHWIHQIWLSVSLSGEAGPVCGSSDKEGRLGRVDHHHHHHHHHHHPETTTHSDQMCLIIHAIPLQIMSHHLAFYPSLSYMVHLFTSFTKDKPFPILLYLEQAAKDGRLLAVP